jgi:hypothetical protein
MELPINILIDGVVQDQVLLCLDLSKMGHLENIVGLDSVVICLNPESI